MVNYNCCPHPPLLILRKTFNNLSQVKASLHGEDLVALLAIVPSDDVHYNMKHKLDFEELKSTSTQKPF